MSNIPSKLKSLSKMFECILSKYGIANNISTTIDIKESEIDFPFVAISLSLIYIRKV